MTLGIRIFQGEKLTVWAGASHGGSPCQLWVGGGRGRGLRSLSFQAGPVNLSMAPTQPTSWVPGWPLPPCADVQRARGRPGGTCILRKKYMLIFLKHRFH